MKKNFLKFWGTRGSCAVSGPEYLHFGGNTGCLEIYYEGTRLVFDAGTGFRPLGQALLAESPLQLDVFLSHMHWDHLIGFPYFDPLFKPGTQITLWSPASGGRSCKELFSNLLSTEFFPVRLEEVQAQLEFRTTQQKTPVQIGPMTIDFHNTHHPGVTHCFKVKTPKQTIGYITDNEMLYGYHGPLSEVSPELLEPYLSLIEFFKGCDLFIHEAQYFPEEYLIKTGWGHSSAANAVALVQRVKPAHWFVTHHDPKHTDADLNRLAALARKMLQEEKIACPVDWIPDGHVIQLK